MHPHVADPSDNICDKSSSATVTIYHGIDQEFPLCLG